MSEQMLVSRDALEKALNAIWQPSEDVYNPGDNHPDHCFHCAVDQGTPHLSDCPVPALQVALAAPAPVETDTWETVNAVAKEANSMPAGIHVRDLSERESDARYELIDSAHDYSYALKMATRIPRLREKYHRDLAEFRAVLAQAQPLEVDE